MANGGLGTFIAAVYIYFGQQVSSDSSKVFCCSLDSHGDYFFLLCFSIFFGTYAACNGDTWASEIGVLSKGDPLLLTRCRRVPKGTNGGISFLGTAASLAGGLFLGFTVSLVDWFICSNCFPDRSRSLWWMLIAVGSFAGFVGSMIDSLLGATLQFSGWDPRKKKVVETPSTHVQAICGYDVLSNNQVNFVTALLTGLLCGLFPLFLYSNV